MFIDTHCHLNFPHYDPDRPMIIGNAKKAGVKKFINPGVDIFSSRQSIELAHKHPGVIFAALGCHPYEAQHDPDIYELESLISSESQSIVAIGECGLDYHQYKGKNASGKKDKQKRLFESHLHIALTYDLPVIIHCRDAYEDFYTVFDGMSKTPRGVIHCFSGGLEDLRMAQERNLMIGIDGNVTYSKQLQAIVPHIPLSMLVLETDAPYLTPVPHRGTRNEPKYIPAIAQCIAQLKQESVAEIEKQTTSNALKLFNLMV